MIHPDKTFPQMQIQTARQEDTPNDMWEELQLTSTKTTTFFNNDSQNCRLGNIEPRWIEHKKTRYENKEFKKMKVWLKR